MSATVFLDLETTGLSLDDDIWEFAAIRREEDGSESELHLFLQHEAARCQKLPESFRLDHERRFPASHTAKWHEDAVSQWKAADLIDEFLRDRPQIVGAVPNFDTERLALLLLRQREITTPPWHHRLRCVETLTAGHLRREVGGLSDCAEALGIDHPDAHTALGDARTCRAIYDAVMGGGA